MHMAGFFDRLAGGRQRLPQHLATVQLAKTQILTASAEQVFLNGFQTQQVDQIVQHVAHSRFSKAMRNCDK
ncbi:hypothetical protein D3C76_1159260 [compost metagenome]